MHFLRGSGFVIGVLCVLSAARAGTLDVSHLPNNGIGNNGGVFMDLTDQTGAGLNITGFTSYASSAAGNPWTVEVYTRPGTYLGFDDNPAGWTLHTTINSTSNGTTTLAPLDLGAAEIPVPPNQTTAVYLIGTLGGIRYNGTATIPPQTTWSNGELMMFSERVRGSPFSTLLFTPRTFTGTISYDIIPEPSLLGPVLGASLLVLRRRKR